MSRHNFSPVGLQPNDRRKTSHPESGAILHSRAGFASESRQERTGVRDWRIERRKARSGKARSLREKNVDDRVYG